MARARDAHKRDGWKPYLGIRIDRVDLLLILSHHAYPRDCRPGRPQIAACHGHTGGKAAPKSQSCATKKMSSFSRGFDAGMK
jgi:hypothetical protein